MLTSLRVLVGAGALALLPGIALADPGDRGLRHTDRGVRSDCEVTPRVSRRHRDRRFRPGHRPVQRPVSRCVCREVVRPGYYKTVHRIVRTPGHYERVWVEGPRVRFGRHLSLDFCGGHYERVWVPGRKRRVAEKVWVPARKIVETRGCRQHHRSDRYRHDD